MSPRQPIVCTHERRPGTTICLLCRQEERLAAAERRQELLRKGVIVGAVVAGVVIIATVGAGAIRMRRAAPTRAPVELASNAKPAATAPVVRRPADDLGSLTAPRLELPALLPMIAHGRTELGAGIWAERTGDTVDVHFDTPGLRTRRRDKFDHTVRTTLRQVYGPGVDTVVAFPAEGIARGRDLVGEVVPTGVRLPLARGTGTLLIRPQTRPGQDGPLVVAYRATLTT